MFSYQLPISHHLEDGNGAPFLQMGQPAGITSQRQQTDDLRAWRNDSHGLKRELQFTDLDDKDVQAMG